MEPLVQKLEAQLAALPVSVAVALPHGRRVGAKDAAVRLEFQDWAGLARFAGGQIGKIAEDYVEQRVRIEGRMRDVMAAAANLLPGSPVASDTTWWTQLLRRARSLASHTPQRDAEQIRFHYDVSDDFYALWLDPRRVYSCAYYRSPELSLAQAQEAKLDHICRKLMLASGERFLDIGAGWGGLLLWAAENYRVDATGITLSRNQHAYVNDLIRAKGLQGRVRMLLLDYRDLGETQRFDKIASVGMFEHVGQANMPAYFGKIHRLLAPGGLVLNHGITAGSTESAQLGAGMGEFIGKYIFPGGELLHASLVLREMATAGLEMVDTENLRPHYARTLWAWSDALEDRLDEARAVLERTHGPDGAGTVLRAYRLYLSGCAMTFEQGWVALHQMLATRPDGQMRTGALAGAQSAYPFTRDHLYR
ncbi:MAG: cyclopropane-fatty-acyl-phospholipid synthase (Cyclopropane fatty acid synthase)-like protein [Ramlibacter sp.]|jgi:cyclopropane-fatty-acyl-phospholipid synthase|uniref:class I SAM-dependent methyltransferase n=1 Tax=Ramlibacter sp. TaxID=1917967 RepID=UPI0026116AE6|nr:class I SAM-dependent methyltransferase [Ramlibacter sp.]MDB5749682.1 cyclopropane-fatty-acyl-phospholipid synthase (Cyclopropane fatty acid synthase)-like protein [Ramlibacter sp.]